MRSTVNALRTQIAALASDLSADVAQYNADVRSFNSTALRGAVRLYMACDLDDDRASIRTNQARLSELETALALVEARNQIAA